MIKPYSFKLNLDNPDEKAIADLIDRLQETEGHTVKSVVSESIARQHGLILPRPSIEATLIKEMRRFDAFYTAQLKFNQMLLDMIYSESSRVTAVIDAVQDELAQRNAEDFDVTTGKVNVSPLYPLSE